MISDYGGTNIVQVNILLIFMLFQEIMSLCMTFQVKNSPCRSLSMSHYRKNPKNSNTQKIAVIILKYEPCGFTIA